jgi:hypothetical protein
VSPKPNFSVQGRPVCAFLFWLYLLALVCLFVFISGTMRFSRYGLGASYLATHNHSACSSESEMKYDCPSINVRHTYVRERKHATHTGLAHRRDPCSPPVAECTAHCHAYRFEVRRDSSSVARTPTHNQSNAKQLCTQAITMVSEMTMTHEHN